MKRSNLSKVVGASILSLSLAAAPLTLSASAQTTRTTAPTTTTSPNVDTRQGTDYTRGDTNDFDWGWLGLLGLIGLAGLAGRKREEPARYREPDEVSRPGSSPRY